MYRYYMLSFSITFLYCYLSIDTIPHDINYYELLKDRADLKYQLDKIDLINKYADIIISIFTGLISVVFTPFFKRLGENISNKFFKKKRGREINTQNTPSKKL